MAQWAVSHSCHYWRRNVTRFQRPLSEFFAFYKSDWRPTGKKRFFVAFFSMHYPAHECLVWTAAMTMSEFSRPIDVSIDITPGIPPFWIREPKLNFNKLQPTSVCNSSYSHSINLSSSRWRHLIASPVYQTK